VQVAESRVGRPFSSERRNCRCPSLLCEPDQIRSVSRGDLGMTVEVWHSAWAKSFHEDGDSEVTHWLPLYQHLDDAAAIAGRLVDLWGVPTSPATG
jgi:hypothetical protein